MRYANANVAFQQQVYDEQVKQNSGDYEVTIKELDMMYGNVVSDILSHDQTGVLNAEFYDAFDIREDDESTYYVKIYSPDFEYHEPDVIHSTNLIVVPEYFSDARTAGDDSTLHDDRIGYQMQSGVLTQVIVNEEDLDKEHVWVVSLMDDEDYTQQNKQHTQSGMYGSGKDICPGYTPDYKKIEFEKVFVYEHKESWVSGKSDIYCAITHTQRGTFYAQTKNWNNQTFAYGDIITNIKLGKVSRSEIRKYIKDNTSPVPTLMINKEIYSTWMTGCNTSWDENILQIFIYEKDPGLSDKSKRSIVPPFSYVYNFEDDMEYTPAEPYPTYINSRGANTNPNTGQTQLEIDFNSRAAIDPFKKGDQARMSMYSIISLPYSYLNQPLPDVRTFISPSINDVGMAKTVLNNYEIKNPTIIPGYSDKNQYKFIASGSKLFFTISDK